MNRMNIFHHRLVSKLLLAGFTFMCLLTDVQAENKVTIDNFNIKPGEEKTVAVYLENDDAMSALQMDITLPQGLQYVANSLTRNEARLDRDTHSLYMSAQTNGNLRLLIVPSDETPIAGNSGAIAYFTVEASSNFVKEGNIELTQIVGSSSEKDEETGFTKKFEMSNYVVDVAPYVGKIYTATDTIAIKTDSTAKRISVVLDNFVDIRSMQASITLPKGLTFVTKENSEKPKFDYGTRLPQNVTISSNYTADGRLKLAVSGMTTECFADTTGEVFAFYVKADTTLALRSDILINDVIVADKAGNSFGLYDEVKLGVTNAYIAHLTPALEMVDSLRNLYGAAIDSIAANAADVKDHEDILATQADLTARIDQLQQFVKEAYDNETLAESLNNIEATAKEIETAIAAWVEKALTDQANLTATNEKAYTRLNGTLDKLQSQLDEAKETINTECADVADQYAADLDSIQTSITELRDSVKADYEALKLTEESTIDSTSIATRIEKVLADAAQAQAAIIANEEAYTRLTEELDSLQAKLDKAKETINTKYQEVADQFAEETANIQASITELRDSVTADYEAVKLTSESTIDSEPITEAIEKLLADAAEAYDKVTGIIGITINDIQSGAVEIYDVTGKKMNTLVKGGNLYIIKHANGKVYKLYVK